MNKSRVLKCRVSPETGERWEKAAASRGQSLSDLIRGAVERELAPSVSAGTIPLYLSKAPKAPQATPAVGSGLGAQELITAGYDPEDVISGMVAPAPHPTTRRFRATPCEHGVPPWQYCAECGA